MLTLGIETSQVPGSVALCRDGCCLAERTLETEKRHAQRLVPEIQRLLSEHGYSPYNCDIVAVSIGPGSFTGLRVGVTCAKAFAYATATQVAAVPTLLAVAHNAPSDVSRLFAISDAQRKQLFVEQFERVTEERWKSVSPVRIVDVEPWMSDLQTSDVVTGPALQKLSSCVKDRCHLLKPEAWHPRAATVARVGHGAIQEGNETDLWALQPLYVRKSAAEEKWDERTAAENR